MSGEVAKYMKRLLVIEPQLLQNTTDVKEDYFDEVFRDNDKNKKSMLKKFVGNAFRILKLPLLATIFSLFMVPK